MDTHVLAFNILFLAGVATPEREIQPGVGEGELVGVGKRVEEGVVKVNTKFEVKVGVGVRSGE